MNRPILRVYGLVVVLFAVLVAFTSRWTVFQAQALRDNALNRRALLEQQRIPRGTIRAADGTVLARSVRMRGGVYERRYPAAATVFAHAVGYSYLRTGQVGLEKSRNDALSGQTGGLTTAMDELRGRQQAGDDVTTTLDPRAQRVALNALGGRRGSVVALDPRTGAVKVMAALPSFDPSRLDDPAVLSRLNRQSSSPLFNRATQAGYPPGSTFKVVTDIAALESGRYTPQSVLSGRNDIPISGVPLRNDAGESFGSVDLTTALTKSINTVWAQVAVNVGKRRMQSTMERLGFNAPPPLDYPPSQLRASGEYYHGHPIPVTSPLVDVGRMGIGQDKLAVTPLQMAMVAAAVANGGALMRPHLTDRVVNPDGRTVDRVRPTLFSQAMRPSTARQVGAMMANVVREGTGTAAALQGISVAGKTGTAQTPQPGLSQAWFIAFAPIDRPRVAVAVTVERTSGQGGTVAAPIAKSVMESLLR